MADKRTTAGADETVSKAVEAGAKLLGADSSTSSTAKRKTAGGASAAKRATAAKKAATEKAAAAKSTATKRAATAKAAAEKKVTAARATAEKKAATAKATAEKKATAARKTAAKALTDAKETAAKKTTAAKTTAAKAATAAKSAAAKKTSSARSTAAAKKTTATKSTAAKTTTAAKSTTTRKTAAKPTAATAATAAAASTSTRASSAKKTTTASKTTATKSTTAAKSTAAKTATKSTAAKSTTAKKSTAKSTTAKTTAKSASAAKTSTAKKTTAKSTTRSTAKSAGTAATAAAATGSGSRRAATSSAKPAPKPSRTATRSADAEKQDVLTQAETPQAAFAASAVDPAPSQPESQGTEAAAAVAAEQPKRSRTGFVVLAALAVAALAAILGFNMRPSALPAPSEQPAIEREVEVEEQEADQETQEDADAQTPLPQGDMQLMEGAGLAFNLPANWVKASENEQRALFSPSNPDENSLVLAANYRYPGGVILDDSELETALQQFAVGLLEGDEFSDATVESIERRTIAGMPAYQVKAQANASGEAMELYTLAVGTNERLWSVVAGADRASFAAAKPLFDEVMSSLRVTAAPVANPATAAASTDAMDVLRSFGEFEETQHDGTGTVLFTSPLYKMPFLMKVSHTGNGAFSVTSLDDNQEWADTLVSAIGNYSGTISNYLFYDQCSYVSVEAEPDAQWQISFVPFTEVDGLVNGGHYAGDGVYLVDAAALQQMRFAHEGSGPLSVWAFSLTEQPAYGQLLNQDGTFDITVPWDQAKSVIMVNGAGNWSVSW